MPLVREIHKANKSDMFDYLISLKEQIGFYFILVKFFIYFCTGAILLFLGKKIFQMGRFLFKSFDKKFFFENIKFFINVILFIIISILVGWITIMLITKRIF